MNPITEIEQRISKRPYGNTVTLPVTLVEALIDYKNDADRLREEKRMLQSQLNYYKNMHPATVRETRILRQEISRLRKELNRAALVHLPAK